MRFLFSAFSGLLLVGAVVTQLTQAPNATTLVALLESTTTCLGCENFLLVLKTLALGGDKTFVDVVSEVCVLSGAADEDVCRGAVGTEGPVIAHDLREMIVPSHTSQLFCTSFVGLCPYPDVRPYLVDFPKPKPNITRPIPNGDTLIQVVHFSDIHIDLEYEAGSNYNCTKPICCRPYTPADAPGNTSYPCGPHGNHECDSPVSLEESLYSAIEQFAPNAAFALFTGDIPDHAIWLVNQSAVTNDIEHAYSRMTSRLNMPVYATAGNHEAAPVNSFPPEAISNVANSQWVYDALSTAWTQWIGTTAASQADRNGAYSYRVPGHNLRIISLNTNFYYTVNFWLYEQTMEFDPDGQLAWLVSELQGAEDQQERVYIIGHMPFGVSDALHDASNYLNQIVNRYEASIAGMFFGHTHLDHFELSYRDTSTKNADTASIVSYICPSLTPTSGSPAFRVYTVDPTMFGILDMVEYSTNLEDASYQTVGPTWSKYYSVKEAYAPFVNTAGVGSELTPAFWHHVTEAFETNDALFQAYYARKRRGWSVAACDQTCRTREICMLRAAESQYNCVTPKPGLQFRKSKRDESEYSALAGGNFGDECHGSLTSEVFQRLVGTN